MRFPRWLLKTKQIPAKPVQVSRVEDLDPVVGYITTLWEVEVLPWAFKSSTVKREHHTAGCPCAMCRAKSYEAGGRWRWSFKLNQDGSRTYTKWTRLILFGRLPEVQTRELPPPEPKVYRMPSNEGTDIPPMPR